MLGDNSNWPQIAFKKPLVLALSFDLNCAVKYASLCLFAADGRFTLGGLDPCNPVYSSMVFHRGGVDVAQLFYPLPSSGLTRTGTGQ